jgi:hypothetical protein
MTPPDFPDTARGWPDAGGPVARGKTLVGGMPWADAGGPGQESGPGSGRVPSPPPVDPEFVGLARAAERARVKPEAEVAKQAGTSRGQGAAPALSWPAVSAAIGRWFHAQVLGTPAWSISLGTHCLLLMALALFVVREHRAEKLRLELAFAGPAGPEAPGLTIAPAAEATKQAEPEQEDRRKEVEKPTTVAKAPERSMERPLVAPPVVPEADTGGAAPPATRAPAVGSLLSGRDEGRRQALVGAGGGSDATEAAVAAALDWLARNAGKKDGLWSLSGPYADGGSQENRLAATAMALIAFQGAGNTSAEGKHRAVVARAWRSLLQRQQENGSFDVGDVPAQHALYSHAQATIALCEAFGMTKDPRFADPAARAVAYAVAAQGPNGGWRYEPGKVGDMSVTGWYMMALKSAEMAGLAVPPATFERIGDFLDTVADDRGVRYGYMRHTPLKPASPVTAAVTAEGLLCRQYLGWQRDDARLVRGLEFLLAENRLDFVNDKDVYAWYYITQVAHHMEGEPWRRWNDALREVLPAEQVKTGRERGSWDPALDRWGHVGGRLFVTCLCAYMLEVYYRHLPLYADLPAAAAAAAP